MSNPQGNDKRLNAIKAERRQAIREKISATKTLNAIDAAEDRLQAMADGVDEPSNGRVGAIRTLLDSKWKKMDRLLPSLKAVEMSTDDGSPLVIKMVNYVANTDS